MFFLKLISIWPFIPSFYRKDVKVTKGSKIVWLSVLYAFLLSFGIVTMMVFGVKHFIVKNFPEMQRSIVKAVNNANFSYIGFDSNFNLKTDLQPQPFISGDNKNIYFYIDTTSSDFDVKQINDFYKISAVVILKDKVLAKSSRDLDFRTIYYKSMFSDESASEIKGKQVSKKQVIAFLSRDPKQFLTPKIKSAINRLIITTSIIAVVFLFVYLLISVWGKAFIFAMLLALFAKQTFKQAFKNSVVIAIGMSNGYALLALLGFDISRFLRFVLVWGLFGIVAYYAFKKDTSIKAKA